MIATYDEDKGLYTLDVPGTPRWKEFVGGLAWANPSGQGSFSWHWYVVIGQQEDDAYMAIIEGKGNLTVIDAELTPLKDNLLIRRIYTDFSRYEDVRALKSGDGLVEYRSKGRDALGRKLYIHTPETWPTFRSRETTATLLPVPDHIRLDVVAGLDRMGKLATDGRFSIHADCVELDRARRLPLREAITHPLLQAVVWVLGILEKKRAREGKEEQLKEVYKNLAKGKRTGSRKWYHLGVRDVPGRVGHGDY